DAVRRRAGPLERRPRLVSELCRRIPRRLELRELRVRGRSQRHPCFDVLVFRREECPYLLDRLLGERRRRATPARSVLAELIQVLLVARLPPHERVVRVLHGLVLWH